jgi:hypothetical protein
MEGEEVPADQAVNQVAQPEESKGFLSKNIWIINTLWQIQS